MSLLLLLGQAVTLAATNYAADAPMDAPSSPPTFADEFDGRKIDGGRWRFDTARNAQGWHNNELQYYSADRTENARVASGALVIEARREALSSAPDWGRQRYTSARLVSRKS